MVCGRMSKTHWLYGHGPEMRLTFVREIEAETDCGKCLHRKVCARAMEQRCENFSVGTSAGKDCQACTHRFTRFDKDAVPCFSCPDFASDEAKEETEKALAAANKRIRELARAVSA